MLNEKKESTESIIRELDSTYAFDIINITAVSSNTIILSFWLHSKYQFSSSSDSSSSVVNYSSSIIMIFYILTSTLSSLTYKIDDNIPEFIIYRGNTFLKNLSDQIKNNCYDVLLITNSISFFLMLNFYFMCIKEVVLRKHLSFKFQNNR